MLIRTQILTNIQKKNHSFKQILSIGKPKHKKVMSGPTPKYFVGKQAESHRGILSLSYPMKHGIIQDFESMKRIWNHIYETELGGIEKEEHPVLITESPLNPERNREEMCEIFFEAFGVPSIFVSNPAILSLYALSKTTGIVLDVGEGCISSVPIYNGYSIQSAIQRYDFGGKDVTDFLNILLRKSGYVFSSSSELEVVKTIKHKTCYVARNFDKEIEKMKEIKKKSKTSVVSAVDAVTGSSNATNSLSLNVPESYSDSDPMKYQLPDGSHIVLGKEQFKAPEILFKPHMFGLEYPGVHEIVSQAIGACDLEIRRDLLSNIVLAGGSSLFKGFGQRILQEITDIFAKKDVKTNVKVFSPPERKYTSWIGGSILTSLGSFSDMWINHNEYKETGAQIVHEKCF